eukprot:EG_transcript_23732
MVDPHLLDGGSNCPLTMTWCWHAPCNHPLLSVRPCAGDPTPWIAIQFHGLQKGQKSTVHTPSQGGKVGLSSPPRPRVQVQLKAKVRQRSTGETASHGDQNFIQG